VRVSDASLRTGESNYLLESYVFYDAIRERQYFRNVLDAKRFVGSAAGLSLTPTHSRDRLID